MKAEDPLVTLESDKATMDVPSPLAGVVQEIQRQGRRQGLARARVILRWSTGGSDAPSAARPRAIAAAGAGTAPTARGRGAAAAPRGARRRGRVRARLRRPGGAQARARARRRPRQGARAAATNGRILHEDVQAFVKGGAAAAAPRPPTGRGGAGGGVGARPAAVAEGRLRQVRPDRAQAAVAHQEDLGRQPAPQLGRRSRTSRSTTKPTSPTSSSSACR